MQRLGILERWSDQRKCVPNNTGRDTHKILYGISRVLSNDREKGLESLAGQTINLQDPDLSGPGTASVLQI